MRILLIMALAMLAGCSSSSDTSDLKVFVDDVLSKPRGRIKPIPVFKPYEAFNYSAAGLRSPFELPVIVDTEVQIEVADDVTPDFDRPKEHLEQFNFGELVMVGTMQGADGALWALVKDGNSSVVRISEGQFMGQNHGKVVSISETRISVVEIVPNGLGGWLERPRTMALEGLGEG